jgi:hypothetical protein
MQWIYTDEQNIVARFVWWSSLFDNLRILIRPSSDALQVIEHNAFVVSPYPLILSLENHLSTAQQDVLAEMLLTIFGEQVAVLPKDGIAVLPSPASLQNKVACVFFCGSCFCVIYTF